MNGPEPACPEWCTGQHPPTWPAHRGETSDVMLGPLVVEVWTAQWEDWPAQLCLTVVEADRETLIYLDPTTAGELVAALGESLAHVYGRGWRP